LLLAPVVALLVASPSVAKGWRPEPSQFQHLDSPDSIYRIPADAQQKIRSILAPFWLDSSLGPSSRLTGVTIERHWIELTISDPDSSASLFLLPPGSKAPAASTTASFVIVSSGELEDEAAKRLANAISANDHGTFWPEAPLTLGPNPEGSAILSPNTFVTVGSSQMAPAHYSRIVGDLIVSTLLLLLLLCAGPILKLARRLSWQDWLAMGAVLAVALFWRLLYASHAPAWAPTHWDGPPVVPPTLSHWLWHTLSRFTPVNAPLLANISLAAGVLSAGAAWAVARLLVSKAPWGALFAGLFVATWPVHVHISNSPSVFIWFPLTLMLWLLFSLSAARLSNTRLHLLAAAFAACALFLRPEGALLMLPLILAPLAYANRGAWRQTWFWFPLLMLLLATVVRMATLHNLNLDADPFLHSDFELGALTNHLGTWVFSYYLMPFPILVVWAAAVASRPWKGDFTWLYWPLAASFMLTLVLYFRTLGPDTPWASRASLAMLPSLAGLAALGAASLARSAGRWSPWVMGLLAAALAAAPLWHWALATKFALHDWIVDFVL